MSTREEMEALVTWLRKTPSPMMSRAAAALTALVGERDGLAERIGELERQLNTSLRPSDYALGSTGNLTGGEVATSNGEAGQ